jgi:peptide/nickel transport system ATP-binding protein
VRDLRYPDLNPDPPPPEAKAPDAVADTDATSPLVEEEKREPKIAAPVVAGAPAVDKSEDSKAEETVEVAEPMAAVVEADAAPADAPVADVKDEADNDALLLVEPVVAGPVVTEPVVEPAVAKPVAAETTIAALDDSDRVPDDIVVPPPLLTVLPEIPKTLFVAHGLSINARGAQRKELDNVSLTLERGERVVLFGEQGSGKEALIRAAAGVLSSHEMMSGQILIGGEPPARSPLRVAYLPGPFLQPLSPHAPAAAQLTRVIARKQAIPQSAAAEDLRAALNRIPGAPTFDELDTPASELPADKIAYGLLACVAAQTPDLVLAEHFVADLPLMQARALVDALKAEQARLGFAILYSARGAHIVNWLGGRVIVLRQGRIVEEGTAERLSSGASHAYTRTLFQAMPRISTEAPGRAPPRGEPLLQVRGLELTRGTKTERELSREGLTFELRRGAALALVGEEGSGRRKLARTLIGLERPGAGRVVLDSVDIGILDERMLQRMRRRVAFIVGNDSVLDERMTVWDTVAEPLRAHLNPARTVLAEQTENALKRVGLASVARTARVARLSAFDRRRLQIARAIVTQPHIAIIEEPLHGLDAFGQGIIRDLLKEFRRQEGPAFLVITADFSVADALAEDAFVMKGGRAIERGPLVEILRNPKELATKNLIDAVKAAALPHDAAWG